MSNPFQDYLQTGAAAAFLGVHPSTLRHWHCDGLPAPPRVEISPHRYAYDKTALAQWKASHEAASAPATPAATPAPPVVRTRTRRARGAHAATPDLHIIGNNDGPHREPQTS